MVNESRSGRAPTTLHRRQLRRLSTAPRGALAFLTVRHDLTDEAIDAIVDELYEQRLQDVGRPVDLET